MEIPTRIGGISPSIVVPPRIAGRTGKFRATKRLLFALVLASIFAPVAQAATKMWNCTDDYWYVTGCWSPTGLPTASDTVYLNPVSGTSTVLKIDNTTGNAYAATITVDSTTAATVTLQQSAGNLSASAEYIGYSGTGAVYQTGGTNTLENAGDLVLGVGATGSGTYDLSGGDLHSTWAEYVGYYGTGSFTQSGGTNTVDSELYLGFGGGSGSYNLSSGDLTDAVTYLGYNSTGSFTQSGGTHTVNVYLWVGYYGSGSYNLSNGDLHVGSDEYIIGGSTFTQSGGTHTVDHELRVSPLGSYNLSSGNLTAANEIIEGSFLQSGGTHTVVNDLALVSGSNPSISITYNLRGGTLDVGGNVVNGASYSIINIDGGTLNVSGTTNVDSFRVGNDLGSTGNFTMGTGKSLIAETEIIGASGSGTFINNGGTNTVTGSVVVAQNIGSHGTYHLAGGTLTTPTVTNNDMLNYSGGALNADVQNAGTFNLSGAGVRVIAGNVVNTGTVKATNTVVAFNGNYTEAGHLVADPATLLFTDVLVTDAGYWVGNAQDSFFVSGNFENHSLQSMLWDTRYATLTLNGNGTQNLFLAGDDLGALYSGYANNFAWGDLTLDSGVSTHLWDGNGDLGAALYVGLFELGDGLGQLADIYSDFNIYYDPNLSGNAYLGGQTYALNGSGFLIPAAVPIPPAVWLFCSGLLGLIGVARRKAA